MADSATENATTKRGFRRRLVGTVKSDKMDKTVVVEVFRRTRDPKYRKYVKSHQCYKAHDEKNEYCVGDQIEIKEFRPISKDKRWVVTRMIRESAARGVAK
jgi:small subunit ribosomal protein S17